MLVSVWEYVKPAFKMRPVAVLFAAHNSLAFAQSFSLIAKYTS